MTFSSQCTFQVSQVLGNWEEHNTAAREMDCNLASVLSGDEQILARGKLMVAGINDLVWIGGKYIGGGDSTAGKKGPDNWEWTDGSEWAYENWAYANGPTGRGECLKLRPMESSNGLRDWNDEDCSRSRPALYKCCGR